MMLSLQWGFDSINGFNVWASSSPIDNLVFTTPYMYKSLEMHRKQVYKTIPKSKILFSLFDTYQVFELVHYFISVSLACFLGLNFDLDYFLAILKKLCFTG